MKKLFIAAIMSLSLLTTTAFAEIKMGIILGFTGPIESLTPAMAASAELAFQEVSDSGSFLDVWIDDNLEVQGVTNIHGNISSSNTVTGFIWVCFIKWYY